MQRLRDKIRNIADFPQPGIQFKDITPISERSCNTSVGDTQMMNPFLGERITAVAGMEARGFIFGSLVAWELGVGFVPLREAWEVAL